MISNEDRIKDSYRNVISTIDSWVVSGNPDSAVPKEINTTLRSATKSTLLLASLVGIENSIESGLLAMYFLGVEMQKTGNHDALYVCHCGEPRYICPDTKVDRQMCQTCSDMRCDIPTESMRDGCHKNV